ncbi:MAG: O-antigen ligase family protein [Acidobacteriota bacterium]
MARIVRIGILAALALPFVVFSVASSEALRESKVLVQALGASLALLGLARGDLLPAPGRRPAARVVLFGLGTALTLAFLSAIANSNVVDPLTAAAVLSPLALLVLGASASGAACATAAATTLMAAGAFTGALAALQRWTGLFRMPLDVPEPRFLAAGLIGNAGDVGMALVVPALLLFTAATTARPARGRVLPAIGLFFALLGLLATEAVGPALAFGAGALLYVALDFRRRRFVLFVLVAAALLAGATGAGRRAVMKLRQLSKGDVAGATTQRDIGLFAAREMARTRPLLGAGPGAFSNRFVPARLAAEEHTGRRLVHRSGSAHFDNAHSEPVTLAAEAGVPAACAAIVAVLALIFGLFSRRGEESSSKDPPVDAILASLVGVAFLALGDFPFRIAVASGPAAFLAGLAIRHVAAGAESTPRRGVRAAVVAYALLLIALAAIRSFATLGQADGENLLRNAAAAPEEAATERAELLSAADARLARAVTLRPRAATAVLAWGSVQSLEGDREKAYALYARSVSLEERAESDLNLGRAAAALGRLEEARALFARTVWIQPRLLDALPAEERERAAAAVRNAEEGLGRGGSVPPFPR